MPTTSPAGPPARRPHGRRTAAARRRGPDLREAILAATARLLAGQSFGDLAVSDILSSAGVSRGTFYFYFDSKQAVLGELVQRAVAQGHAAAGPGWPARPTRSPRCGPGSPPEPSSGRRARRSCGPSSRTGAPTRASPRCGSSRCRPSPTPPWPRSPPTRAPGTPSRGQDIPALASALTWLSERLYYLAATGTPPFDDRDTLVSTLLRIWASALYQSPAGAITPAPQTPSG